MTSTTTPQPTQRSPEWFAQRTNRLTGSNVGAVLGLDPYRTREDVMRMMVRDYHGAEREFVGNIATMHGQGNEETARFDFQLETGYTVEECGFFPYEDWLGASPDGAIRGVFEHAILEIKCPFGKRKDENPVLLDLWTMPHYEAQIQIEMLCAGHDAAYFYQWTPNGSKLEVVKASAEWRAENLPKLAQFYAEYLHERDNNADHLAPLRVSLDTPQTHKMAQEYDELAEQIERATERKKDLLAEMVTMAGGKDALFAGRKLTKVEKDGAVSYAAVIKEHLPKLDLTKYRGKPSEYWMFK